jgi:hypothetical protein
MLLLSRSTSRMLGGGMAGKIFINYRRNDDSGAAGRLYDRLEEHYGKNDLFMDVDDIAAGADFVRMLEEKVSECDVFLAVIGKRWLDADGEARLDDPNDFVRIEIASALGSSKHVIPVLVNGAAMPRAQNLPEPLKPLSRRNAVRLTHERFKNDVVGLVNNINAVLAEAKTARLRAEAELLAAEEAQRQRDAEKQARAVQLARESDARAEAEAWAKAAQSLLLADIEDFLEKWPDSVHANEALSLRRQLRDGFFGRNRVLTTSVAGLMLLGVVVLLVLLA